MRKLITRLSLLLVIAFGMAAVAFAQNARISGKVTDPHGSVVVGAEVQVINLSTGNKFVTKTGNDGAYNAPFLPAGHYQIIVSAKGFSQASKGDLAISDGQVSVYDAKLTIGAVSEQVTVKGTTESISNANPKAKIGPWSDTAIQDLPYAMTVLPSQLLENLQAWSQDDAFKVVPEITNWNPSLGNEGNGFAYLRGFPVSSQTYMAGTTYDGLLGQVGGTMGITTEDKERVEVLSGVNGFLYGIGSVGGNINYVLKRPTDVPYYSVTAGSNAGENGYLHVDFSGPLTKIASYRFNGVFQNGATSIIGQNIKRNLIAPVIDLHLLRNLFVQLNYAHSDEIVNGTTPAFGYTSDVTIYPKAPDPSRVGFPSWTVFSDHTDTAGVKAVWDINQILTLRSAYAYTREWTPSYASVRANIIDNAGDIKIHPTSWNDQYVYKDHSAYMFLDAKFKTGRIQHNVTTGFTGWYQPFMVEGPIFISSGPATTTFYNMVNFAEPSYSYGVQQPYVDNHFYTENYMVGDQIALNSKLFLMAGGNYVITKDTYFLSPGVTYPPASYSASKFTPSASLVYKPVSQITTYFTYQQSLQPGQSVLNGYGLTYTNAPSVLPPYLGHQYELGVKATVAPGVLLTAALFDIDKANIYTLFNSDGTATVVESGRQVNKGVELTASGKVRHDLTILGGITLLDPKITNDPSNPKNNGQNAATTASASGKLYAEYSIPEVKNFIVNGGIRYSGSMWINLPNTLSIPAYSVEDLGARYASKISENKALTYRFNINNVTNKAYWQGGSYLGAPRTFMGTVQLQF